MNSGLYRCVVMHNRLRPRRHAFSYNLFMFAIDLDELDMLKKKLWLVGSRRNAFTFHNEDHIRYGSMSTRESVVEFIRRQGVSQPVSRVLLVTHLRTLGYVFNPVSFYFCLGEDGSPLCAVAEVNNTFGEMKPYLVPPAAGPSGEFRLRRPKEFYVSPFIDLDVDFDFRLRMPGEDLKLFITDYSGEDRLIVTSLVGKFRPLTNARLAWYALRFPFMTLRIIGLIHWQAFRLYMKKIPFHRKAVDPHLQKEVFHAGS
jgi:DUF1365 family protein